MQDDQIMEGCKIGLTLSYISYRNIGATAVHGGSLSYWTGIMCVNM